jgi:antitoxin VapB
MVMGLYVRDESVNRLAEEVQKAIGAATKTEAVRIALERILEAQQRKVPFSERLKKLQAETLALGDSDPDFDQKAYRDEMWGDL